MQIKSRDIKDVLIGQKIVLVKTDDPYTNLKTGDTGTIDYIDDTGTIFVKWLNGSRLGVIPGYDKFVIYFTREFI